MFRLTNHCCSKSLKFTFEVVLALLLIGGSLIPKKVVARDFNSVVSISSETKDVLFDSKRNGDIGIYYDYDNRFDVRSIKEIPFHVREKFDVYDPSKKYTVWLKITIHKALEVAEPWALFNIDQNVGAFTVYYFDGDSVVSAQGGKSLPFKERLLSVKHPAITLNLGAGGKRTYYIKYTGNLYFLMWPRLMPVKDLIAFENKEYNLLALAYGVLAIMAVYNLILFGFIQDKKYLYFVLYTACTALFLTNGDSYLFQYLWPNTPGINKWLFLCARPMLVVAYLLYVVHFLELNKRASMVWFALGVVFFLIFIFDALNGYSAHFYLIPTFYLLACYFALLKIKEGFEPAKYFLLGTLVVTVGIINTTLISKGLVISQGFWQYYLIYFCIVIELILYSISLAQELNFYRSKKIKYQEELILQLELNEDLKDKVNKELEAKVKQRTEALKLKNDELNSLTEQLNTANAKLDLSLWKKSKALIAVTKQSVLTGVQSFEEFSLAFPDEVSCMRYLSELKWKSGFACKKCGNEKWNAGDAFMSRKCTKCNKRESVTSNTIFHRLRFPLQRAMYIVYVVKENDKLPLKTLAEDLDMSSSTCSIFRNKVRVVLDGLEEGSSFENLILKSE